MPRHASRQGEVLALIVKYGIISTKLLWELMDRKIGLNHLRSILNALHQKNLIICPNEIFGHSALKYWMLPLDSHRLKTVAQIMDLPLDQVRQSAVRYNEYPHEDLCTMIQASIERIDQRVTVFRARARKFHGIAEHLLSDRIKRLGYCPDLILRLPTFDKAGEFRPEVYRWIAVEVDRTYRTKTRLAQRLNTYTKHTGFAGLLYFMPTAGTATRLHKLFASRGSKDSIRLHNSSESFLATAAPPKSLFDAADVKVFLGTCEMSLLHWLSVFMCSEAEKRDKVLREIASKAPEIAAQAAETQAS